MSGNPRRSGLQGILLGVMLLTTVAAFAEWSWFGIKKENPTLENLKVVLLVKPESQIYPSFIIANAAIEAEKLSTATPEIASAPRQLGESDGLIKVSLMSPADPSKLKLVVTSPEIMDESTF